MRFSTLILAVTLAACASGGSSGTASPGDAAPDPAAPPALARAGDTAALRRDMFAMAGDAMRGREAGTLDELRAAGWVAQQAERAGLAPAGDDGTFYQWWPMQRSRLGENSRIAIGGRALRLWTDVVVMNANNATVDLPVVFVADSAELARTDVHGRAVAMPVSAIATQPASAFTIRGN